MKDLNAKKKRWSNDNVVITTKKTIIKSTEKKPKIKTANKKKFIKRKKRFNYVGKEFLQEIYPIMIKVLPKKQPYKIGIHKDVFEHIEAMYNDKKKLKDAIAITFNGIVNSQKYLKSMYKGNKRYGLNSKEFTLDPEHQKWAKIKYKSKEKIIKKQVKREKALKKASQ